MTTESALFLSLAAFTCLFAPGACKASKDGDNRKERQDYQKRNDLKGK